MSFLNPVNEPVLRFKSTDAGAPQINYNARVAGDVKAVLKACLVTGYGAKAGAGWTTVNETATVIEFVSPSAAMSDYRLGIDDTSTSSTTWYYQFQNTKVDPTSNAVAKTPANVVSSNENNSWVLIVSNRGFYFIESMYVTVYASIVSRITCFGQMKSGLDDSGGKNMAFWSVGLGAPSIAPAHFFKPETGVFAVTPYHVLESYSTGLRFTGVNLDLLEHVNNNSISKIEISAPVYVGDTESIVAEYAGLLIKNSNTITYGSYNTTFNGRSVFYTCTGAATTNTESTTRYSVPVMIYLDYWEY